MAAGVVAAGFVRLGLGLSLGASESLALALISSP